MSKPKNVLILGAAGRDFHNFNCYFRKNPLYHVVAFTAQQIPGIDNRSYPAELAGKELYPKGIPIKPESDMLKIIKEEKVEEVILAYSDLSHSYVMEKASIVLAAGPDFKLMGPSYTQLVSSKPVVAVTAVRTGVGKSQTTRFVVETLKKNGKKVCVVRHPMPYGDLVAQACQRYEVLSDMDKHKCTIEEREEYEKHIQAGTILYAGVDYEMILRSCEKECDVVLWDGGNNDFPFFKSDLHICLIDPHRPGAEINYYPGAANARRATVLIIAKCNTAKKENLDLVVKNCKAINPSAKLIMADSEIITENKDKIKGKKVVVIEDGPTLTHGEMLYGAGVIAAQNAGAIIVDPKPYAVKSIKATYDKYTHVANLIPAMGYGAEQVKDLEDTINKVPCDFVICGTPIDLTSVVKVKQPIIKVTYDYKDKGELAALIKEFLNAHCKK